MRKTIALKGDFIRKERVAAGPITPGELIELASATTVQAHSTPGGNAPKAFALENDLVGDGIDDAYGAGDTVQYGVFQRGAEVYALLAHGENVNPGDPLESDGNGALQAHTAIGSGVQVDAIVGYALEAVNNTSGADARIKIEVA